MDVTPLVFDLETCPLDNAANYLQPPDVSDIQPPANYVKAEAIAEYVKRKTAERLADFETDCKYKAALDPNVARIAAMGWWTAEHGLELYACTSEADEREVIEQFWQLSKHRPLVGFRIREFDLPMLIQRSRYLGMTHPSLDLGRYSRGDNVIDLFDLLTFNGIRLESVMRHSLHAFCKRFGIPVDDTIKGADIPALVKAEQWSDVLAHVRSDVELTVQLARRLHVLREVPVGAA